MKRFFQTTALTLATLAATAQCSDLFFSEYIEGSSSNKALEIYNPTDAPVDLSDYALYRANNGASTPGDTLIPTGTLAPGGVWIAANPSANASILALADTTHSITFYNGDDAIWLVNETTGDTLDIIGIIGQDPGSSWPVGLGATQNFTLIRMPGVQGGTKNWTLSASQWIVKPIDDIDSLGMHTMMPCPGGPCGELFFSEYIEGSSSNKAFEVYNPTSSPIDLSSYVIYRANNGSPTPTDSLFPVGTVAAGDVFVIANPSANAAILAQADTQHTLTFYNGDDAMWIKNTSTGDTLDIIGEIGVDPGSGWTVGGGATNNNTLIRKKTIQQGQKDWSVGATEWDVFAIDMTDSLGAHTMNSCGTVSDPQVSFAAVSMTVQEPDGSVDVTVTIASPNANPTSVDVVLAGGSATSGTDFTFTSPTTVTFPGGSGTPQVVNIPITDDVDMEPTETIILELQNATNNATLGSDSISVVSIEDDDTPLPVYPIATVTTVDAAGVADSLDVECEVRGVVTSVNYRPAGLQFWMHDGTGGINVFSFGPVSGYAPTMGDSIHVQGTIEQFAGLQEIMPDSVLLVSAGNALPKTQITDMLDESWESEVVKIVGYSFVDTSEWTGSGSGFNVRVSKGTDTLVVRVDNDVDLFLMPVPADSLNNFSGVVTQFDLSSPFTDGYQVLVRSSADREATQTPAAGFTFVPGTTVSFTDTSTNCPTDWLWDFGDGNTSTDQHPTHTYASTGSYTVCLTASNPAGMDSTCSSVNVTGIAQLDPGTFSVYPNPAESAIWVSGDVQIDAISIYDLAGRLLTGTVDNQGFIAVGHLPAGEYVLQVKTTHGVWKTLFVRQ